MRRYRRTKKGMVMSIYTRQKTNSRARGHKQPSYTFGELFDWLTENESFHRMFSEWEQDGFKPRSRLRPSIDRIDNALGYSFSNIRLVSWGTNDDNGHRDFKNGSLINTHKAVVQTLNDGTEVLFVSQESAARATGCDHSHISKCCRGKLKTTGGFKWRFAKPKKG